MAYEKTRLDNAIDAINEKLRTHDNKYRRLIKAWKVAKKPSDTASKEDKDNYAKLEVDYDAQLNIRTALQTELNTAIKTRDDFVASEKEKESKSKTEESIDSLKARLEQAKRMKDPAAVQSAQDALDAATTALTGKAPASTAEPTSTDILFIPSWKNNNQPEYRIDADPNKGVIDKTGKTVYFVINKAGQTSNALASLADARNFITSNYTAVDWDNLKKQLVASSYLSKKAYESNDAVAFNAAFNSAIFANSVNNVQNIIEKKNNSNFVPFTDFLNGQKTTGGTESLAGTDKITGFDISTRPEADREADAYFMELQGQVATQAQKDSYFKALHAEELAAESGFVYTTDAKGKRVKEVTSGYNLTAADKLVIAAKVAGKSLGVISLENLQKNGSGIAQSITSVQTLANKYGIQLSAADALEYVKDGLLRGGDNDNKVATERIKQLSMQLYPNLKEFITTGGIPMDVANTLAKLKTTKLGITIPNAMADSDVVTAMGNNTNQNDFNRMLQGKPEWRNTPEAHSIIADMLGLVGKTYGRIG